ncbi:LysR family transcriptional regulator [Undibacterium sp. Rencai35W]|uniref:LysR family transcriptional regulator n=1 Tax=Undibacterium sp. Rencai35W TaxID=3413046 RepID=UPI003BF1F7A7
MSDRLDAMAVLIAVVDAGSFSGAARNLGMPLATVSRKVSDLESHLNARLLLRSTRKLTLTEAGQIYLVACRRILEEIGAAERLAAGEFIMPKGELVITAPVVFGRLHVLPVIADFLQRYPEIDIRLILADRTIHLLEDHVDLALRIGNLPDSDWIAYNVGEIRLEVCASPVYLAQHGSPLMPEQLRNHDCITFDSLMSGRNWVFSKNKSEISIGIHSRLTVNTAEAAIDAAIAGVGLTRVLSYQIEEAKRQGRLQVVLDDFDTTTWPVNLVHAGQGMLPLKLRAFIDYAKPALQQRLLTSS